MSKEIIDDRFPLKKILALFAVFAFVIVVKIVGVLFVLSFYSALFIAATLFFVTWGVHSLLVRKNHKR